MVFIKSLDAVDCLHPLLLVLDELLVRLDVRVARVKLSHKGNVGLLLRKKFFFTLDSSFLPEFGSCRIVRADRNDADLLRQNCDVTFL